MAKGWDSLMVRDELKKELDSLKIIPDETYQSLIRRLIEGYKKKKNATK